MKDKFNVESTSRDRDGSDIKTVQSCPTFNVAVRCARCCSSLTAARNTTAADNSVQFEYMCCDINEEGGKKRGKNKSRWWWHKNESDHNNRHTRFERNPSAGHNGFSPFRNFYKKTKCKCCRMPLNLNQNNLTKIERAHLKNLYNTPCSSIQFSQCNCRNENGCVGVETTSSRYFSRKGGVRASGCRCSKKWESGSRSYIQNTFSSVSVKNNMATTPCYDYSVNDDDSCCCMCCNPPMKSTECQTSVQRIIIGQAQTEPLMRRKYRKCCKCCRCYRQACNCSHQFTERKEISHCGPCCVFCPGAYGGGRPHRIAGGADHDIFYKSPLNFDAMSFRKPAKSFVEKVMRFLSGTPPATQMPYPPPRTEKRFSDPQRYAYRRPPEIFHDRTRREYTQPHKKNKTMIYKCHSSQCTPDTKDQTTNCIACHDEIPISTNLKSGKFRKISTQYQGNFQSPLSGKLYQLAPKIINYEDSGQVVASIAQTTKNLITLDNGEKINKSNIVKSICKCLLDTLSNDEQGKDNDDDECPCECDDLDQKDFLDLKAHLLDMKYYNSGCKPQETEKPVPGNQNTDFIFENLPCLSSLISNSLPLLNTNI